VERTVKEGNKIAERLLGEGWMEEGEKVWEKGGEKTKGEAKLWGLGHW